MLFDEWNEPFMVGLGESEEGQVAQEWKIPCRREIKVVCTQVQRKRRDRTERLVVECDTAVDADPEGSQLDVWQNRYTLAKPIDSYEHIKSTEGM